jgi:hypothetical protein
MRIEAVQPRGIGDQLNGLPRACLVVLCGGATRAIRVQLAPVGRGTKRQRCITREPRRTTPTGIAAVLPSWSCRSHATNHEQYSHEVKQRSHCVDPCPGQSEPASTRLAVDTRNDSSATFETKRSRSRVPPACPRLSIVGRRRSAGPNPGPTPLCQDRNRLVGVVGRTVRVDNLDAQINL